MKARGKVREIRIRREKGKSFRSIPEGLFRVDFGLVGDIHSGPGPAQVLLLGREGRERLKDSPEEGLCFRRFRETITTEGIDLFKLPVGTRVKIGETLQEITRVGKRCFPECVLIGMKQPCVLSREVVMTRVLREGKICIGDSISLLPDSSETAIARRAEVGQLRTSNFSSLRT